jgi:hypothetical protein
VIDIILIIVVIVLVAFAVEIGRSWWRQTAWRRRKDDRD